MGKQRVEAALKLLLIDDDEVIHKSVGGFLQKMDYQVFNALDAEEGLAIFREQPIDIVISDLKMPGMDGLELVETLTKEGDDPEIILMTGHGDMNVAVDALRKGVFDFFRKPVVLDELLGCLQRTKRYRNMRLEKKHVETKLQALQRNNEGVFDRYMMIGESKAFKDVLALVDKVSESDRTTVLIQGESGTGKELIARAIHSQSRRKDAPFISVNCTAIPDTLLESELFGHEKGAFTDARDERLGVFELGDGGTLFMDEVGDMNLMAQSKILRALEERSVRRVGGSKEIDVDVRLITATNQDIKTMVANQTFREDLYFRLNVFVLALPPLRERGDDVLLLAHYFLKQFASELRKDISGMSGGTEQLLKRYPFPGNIRELRNLIERAVILCEGHTLIEADFPDLHNDLMPDLSKDDMPLNLGELEKHAIRRALHLSNGNQTEAAKHLGIGHDALRYRIKKLEIVV